jgi:sulfofructose kinase
MSSPDDAPGKLVVCAGMAVIDHVYRLTTFPTPGTKTRAQDFFSVLGGCAANAAITVSRLGGRARAVSPLGGPAVRDLTGDNVLAKLAREDVDVAHVVRMDGAVSSRSSIFIAGDGERTIVSYRDPALELARPHDPVRAISGADSVLVDNRFPEFVLPIVRAAAVAGKIVVLDGDKPMGLTDELLTLVTHIVFSADGLRATADAQDLAAALAIAAQRTDAMVAVTDGPRDMLWLEEGCSTACRHFVSRWSTHSARATSSTARSRSHWARVATWRRPCASRPPPQPSNALGSAAGQGRRSAPTWNDSSARLKKRLPCRIFFYI